MRRVIVLLCLVGAPVLPVRAQDHVVSVTALGGAILPLSDARDAMGTGWDVGVAGSVTLRPGLAVRADYIYSRFAAAEKPVVVTFGPFLPAQQEVTVQGKSQMHAGSIDLVWTARPQNRARLYVMAGPTFFRRRVQLRGPDLPRQAEACEPQWLQCSDRVIEFDRWLGIRESDDLGFNVGAGVAFPVGLTASLVVEARYFRVIGPTFRAADGTAASGSAHFVPVMVGLRF